MKRGTWPILIGVPVLGVLGLLIRPKPDPDRAVISFVENYARNVERDPDRRTALQTAQSRGAFDAAVFQRVGVDARAEIERAKSIFRESDGWRLVPGSTRDSAGFQYEDVSDLKRLSRGLGMGGDPAGRPTIFIALDGEWTTGGASQEDWERRGRPRGPGTFLRVETAFRRLPAGL